MWSSHVISLDGFWTPGPLRDRCILTIPTHQLLYLAMSHGVNPSILQYISNQVFVIDYHKIRWFKVLCPSTWFACCSPRMETDHGLVPQAMPSGSGPSCRGTTSWPRDLWWRRSRKRFLGELLADPVGPTEYEDVQKILGTIWNIQISRNFLFQQYMEIELKKTMTFLGESLQSVEKSLQIWSKSNKNRWKPDATNIWKFVSATHTEYRNSSLVASHSGDFRIRQILVHILFAINGLLPCFSADLSAYAR